MKNRVLKLILLGSVSPLIGVLIFLIQLQINPRGFLLYMTVQSTISIVFLSYFFFCAMFLSKKDYNKTNAFFFFFIPFLLVLYNLTFRKIIRENIIVSILLLGIDAPFHNVLPYLYFPADEYSLIPFLFPNLLCFISFKLGENFRFHLKRIIWTKTKRVIAAVCVISMCLMMYVTTIFTQEVNCNDGCDVFSSYEIAAGLVPGKSVSNTAGELQNINSNIVCVMRIYSDPGSQSPGSSLGDFGHTFLTFLNVSASNITVGQHTVESNKMISIGKFGMFAENEGAFYNTETNRKERFGWYASDRSTYMELTASQLKTVSTYLKNHQKGYSEIGNSCAFYAVGAWNSILSVHDASYIEHSATPALVYKDIGRIESHYVGNKLLSSDYELCYYDGTTRKLCSDYF